MEQERRTCWECDNCGWQVLDPQISLEDAVCLCGVGAGRWRVSTARVARPVPVLTALRAKEFRDELCRRLDELKAEGHLDEHAAECLSGISEWLGSFDDREPGEGFEVRPLRPAELLPVLYPQPGTVRS